MYIVGGLVGDNRGGIADDLSIAISKIRTTGSCRADASDGFFLVEIQREYHVADFPACRQKMNSHRHGVELASVALVFLAIVAKEVVFDDRYDHLLKADTAVDEIQTAALHLDANTFSRCEAFIIGIAVEEFYRKKILRL